MSTEKFSVWVYWMNSVLLFWQIKPCNLSHVVLVTPIFPGIYFYHSFYGMISRFKSNRGEGVHFNVKQCLLLFAKSTFFNWKLNIPSFIFLIWQQQFWIWFSLKFKKKHQFFFVFRSFSYFTPYMIFEPWFRSINW